MKKIFATVLVLMMCLSLMAGAEGLGGLGGGQGGGLSGLTTPVLEPSGVLPDPESVLGTTGTVLAEDYAFASDYLCTAYTYAMPADMERFLAAYSEQARDAGYTMTAEMVDGMPGYRFSLTEQEYALMVPNFNGGLLLLVKNGLEFGEPLPEGYYLQVWRNGRKLFTSEPDCKEKTDYINNVRCLRITGHFERSEAEMLIVGFPNYAQTGDTFEITKKGTQKGMYFYTDVDGIMVYLEPEGLTSNQDYYRVEITDMYQDSKGFGTVIEGVFEASVKGGKLLYTDGSFRILLED